MAGATRIAVLPRPRAGLDLAAGEIHVWRARLDAATPAALRAFRPLLSADEVERARRFYFERDRRRFIVCRGILRSLLGSYLGLAPARVAFRYGANEKPALAESAGGAPLFFNLAHSEDLALYAFTRTGEVGIDVERIRELPDWRAIAELSFGAEELARLRGGAEETRCEEFFHAWTRQEAILKAAGTGLGGARPGRGAERATTARATLSAEAFQVCPLVVDPGFAAALAVQPSRPLFDIS